MSASGADAAVYSAQRISGAARATYAAFIGAGFAFASWASRIPQVRDRLRLSDSDLGFVLLAIAVGSLVALPLSGIIVQRFSSRRAVAGMSMLFSVGLAIIATGYLVGVVPLLAGMFVLGFANGAWDVAMNVQGAMVERHLARAIMPRFHAGYSAGTVAGAGSGALMVALAVPVTAHLLFVAVVIGVLIPRAVRRFLSDAHEPNAGRTAPEAPQPVRALRRWREPRTLLIGFVVLAFGFSEGSGNDWVSIALIDDHHTSAVVGTLGFAAFLSAMTALRWFGTGVVDRFGRVTVLRGLAVVAAAGLLLFVLSPSTPLAFVGVMLWGAGASLGFPLGMSAAADKPAAAAGRVAVVASIGYCAHLGGPPLIGFLGEHVTVLRALLSIAVLLALAAAAAGALRPPAASED